MRSATIRRKSASRVSVRSGQRNVMDQPHYANPTHPSLTIEPEQDPSRQPTIILSARRGTWKRIGWPVGRAGAGIAVTMLLCALLAALGLGATLNGGMVTLGFDPERAQFIQYVLMTLIGSLAAGFVLRSRRQPGWWITLFCRWLSGSVYCPGAASGAISRRRPPVARPRRIRHQCGHIVIFSDYSSGGWRGTRPGMWRGGRQAIRHPWAFHTRANEIKRLEEFSRRA